jgi:hypothetical protein
VQKGVPQPRVTKKTKQQDKQGQATAKKPRDFIMKKHYDFIMKKELIS